MSREAANSAPRPAPADASMLPQKSDRDRSPWPLKLKVRRVMWWIVRALIFRLSFHNWYGLRNVILRVFGARIGQGVRVRPTVAIEMPWNLDLRDNVVVGDHAILYSLGLITIGARSVVSQYAHLCAGSHDYTLRSFPLLTPPITLGEDVWVAADAFVGPGVTVGDRAVVAARATVMKDVPPEQVVGGNPARMITTRELRD